METRSVNPSRMDREDEKKMLPCRFFVHGFCHKGNRCRFYHPQPGAITTMLVVPPLPPHFSTPPQISPNTSRNAPYPVSTPPPPPTGRSNLGPRRVTRSDSMLNAADFADYAYSQDYNLPPSPTYSEYDLAYNQQYEPEPAEDPQPQQNTVFNHIDWAQFLAPGYLPPPPIHINVEDGSTPSSPTKPSSIKSPSLLALKNSLKLKLPDGMDSDDTPPEGRKPLETKENTSVVDNGKLSAKLELQMKVQQIAKELADEPAQHVRNLDSFFRTYNFNALPLSNGSLLDEDEEENCEKEEEEKEDAEANVTPVSISIEATDGKENIPTPTSVN